MEKSSPPPDGKVFHLHACRESGPKERYLRQIEFAKTLVGHQQTEEALIVFGFALEETNWDVERQARVYYERAQIYNQLGMAREALSDLTTAQEQTFASVDSRRNQKFLYKISKLGESIMEASADKPSPSEVSETKKSA